MRTPPLVPAVSGQYRVPRMRVHHPFPRAHDTGHVGEAYFHLTVQFSRLDMVGIARDLGGVPAFPAAAKYQLIVSFVILMIAGIIRSAADRRISLLLIFQRIGACGLGGGRDSRRPLSP